MTKTKKTALAVAVILTIVLFVGLDVAGATALVNGEAPIGAIYWLAAAGYAAGGYKIIRHMEVEE